MPQAYANLILRYGDKFITVDIPAARTAPAQCIFPGGTVDQKDTAKPDPSMRYAALREFDEETKPDNGTGFRELLKSKGLSFEQVEKHMKLVGAMDNEHQQNTSNPGLHADYELDLSKVPGFQPPTFTAQDFEKFGKQLSPKDDLERRNGKIVVRELSDINKLLQADKFKGGLRASMNNVCQTTAIPPKITTYSGTARPTVTNMDARWEQNTEQRLSLSPKSNRQPNPAPTTTKTTTSPGQANPIGLSRSKATTKDWAKVRAGSAPPKATEQLSSIFKLVSDAQSTNLDQVKKLLSVGKVPTAQNKDNTLLDVYIKDSNQEKRTLAADLIATYSVKQVMAKLDTNVKVQMVDNNRAASTSKQHDRHAMKVTFDSQEEAKAFADKLFKQHGIHSYTFGADTPKTPQNGSVFLTKDDLEKIAQTSQITLESGSGARAYQTKASIFEQKKTVDSSNSPPNQDEDDVKDKLDSSSGISGFVA